MWVDRTPYEKLKKKKRSLDNVYIFGCLAQSKVELVNLKKIDARLRPLVDIGFKPCMKAYRLLNPTTHKIIMIRDVIFYETKWWDWQKDTRVDNELPCSFTILWDNHSIGTNTLGQEGEDESNMIDNETVEVDHENHDYNV